MAKTGKSTALVAIDGGKWHVSFHDSIDAATSYGQSRLKNIEDGWSIETEDHFAEVPDEQLPSLYSFLAPKGATVPDEESIRAETWALISKDLAPPPAPVAEAADDEPQPEEEDLNTQPEAEAPAKPARTRTPAKAPAKAPVKAAARPAPARPAPARAAARRQLRHGVHRQGRDVPRGGRRPHHHHVHVLHEGAPAAPSSRLIC